MAVPDNYFIEVEKSMICAEIRAFRDMVMWIAVISWIMYGIRFIGRFVAGGG